MHQLFHKYYYAKAMLQSPRGVRLHLIGGIDDTFGDFVAVPARGKVASYLTGWWNCNVQVAVPARGKVASRQNLRCRGSDRVAVPARGKVASPSSTPMRSNPRGCSPREG